jgi:hypothetical protein
MAMVGEFRFTALGVPTQDVVRIWLVKEPNERGFGFSVLVWFQKLNMSYTSKRTLPTYFGKEWGVDS